MSKENQRETEAPLPTPQCPAELTTLDQAVSTGQGEVARAGGLACLGDTTLLPCALPHQAQFKKPCRTASGHFPDALQDSCRHRGRSLSSYICSIHHCLTETMLGLPSLKQNPGFT